ncbi:hypothetical protein [Flavobacterium hydatis]|uniref:Lipoprotein n=1 Tax=Flavobacterium hydatis TaxID=991 RepID=A0A086ANZ6_FLAHY|nr:hypothetical protein [Flavobacterium hydatis]KFF18410.1 hypothetical protein IW20_05805 [Flavobacterium hydatis]OXA96842.1 hypothetical protein B0A62_06210 [Flavobacterium hydatis]
MRSLITLIFSILFISCSSTKVEKQIIDDFLKNEPRAKNIEVLVQEAVPITEALKYYENAYNQRNLFEGEIRFAPNEYPPYTWEIDSTEIGILKKKYQTDTVVYNWKKRDFTTPKLIITPKKRINSPENQKYGYGMYLSRPLITQDKKHAFLFYRFFAVGMGSSEKKAVLLKKVDGKWVELYYYNNVMEIN